MALTVVVVALVLAGGCSRGSAEPVPAEELPVGDALSSVSGRTSTSGTIMVGTVLVTGMDRLIVDGAVVVEEVAPLRADPAVQVIDVVASFMRRDDEFLGQGFLGEKCLAGWPPARALAAPGSPVETERPYDDPGWLYPVDGLELRPGDEVSFALVSRPTRTGEWSAEGLRIVYRHDGRRYQQTSESHTVSYEASTVDSGEQVGCDGT